MQQHITKCIKTMHFVYVCQEDWIISKYLLEKSKTLNIIYGYSRLR